MGSKRQRDMQVDGVRLEALEYPALKPAGPTLVFLHDGLGCVATWRDFPQAVCERTGLGGLVYSRQGYGSSDPCVLPRPLDYMHDEALRVLPAVLLAAGIKEHVVIGHSDGASIGLIHAGNPVTRGLLGLVCIAPHVFCEELSVHSIRDVKQAYLDGEMDERLQKHHGSNAKCAFLGWNDAWLHPEFRDWNITDYLPHIAVPQLLIQGENDEFGTRAQILEITKRCRAPVDVEMLADCGHSPMRDQGAATLALIARFGDSLLNCSRDE